MDSDTTATIKTTFYNVSKGSNFLSRPQLEELLYVLGCKPLLSEPYFLEIASLFDKADKRGITYDSFIQKLSEMSTVKQSQSELVEALSLFDEEGKGRVHKSELRRALMAYSKLSKTDIDNLLNVGGTVGEYVDIKELLKKLEPQAAVGEAEQK